MQYLRGLAAIAVVFFHAAHLGGVGAHVFGPTLGEVFLSGRLGVDLFFVISGFIITVVSLHGSQAVPSIDRRIFFERRFARIVPLMWVAICGEAAVATLQAGGVPGAWQDYVHALLLLPYGDVLPITIWTLRQELVFYLVFAWALLGPVRRWWLLWAWAVAGLASTVAITIGKQQGWLSQAALDAPWLEGLRVIFSFWSVEFAAGMTLGIAWLRRGGSIGIRLPVHPLVLMAAAVALVLASSRALPQSLAIMGIGLLPVVLLVAIVALAVHVDCPPGALSRVGLMFGNASYSIYLFHLPTMPLAFRVLSGVASGVPPWLLTSMSAAIAIGFGLIVHRVVEKPLVLAVRRLLRREPGAVAIPPSRP